MAAYGANQQLQHYMYDGAVSVAAAQNSEGVIVARLVRVTSSHGSQVRHLSPRFACLLWGCSLMLGRVFGQIWELETVGEPVERDPPQPVLIFCTLSSNPP